MNFKFEYYMSVVHMLEEEFGQAPKICFITGTSGPDLSLTDKAMPFDEVFPFAVSMVEGHTGKMDVIKMSGQDVCVVQGRLHYYQGFNIEQVVFLARVLALWGCKKFIFTNASGALKDKAVGSIVNITDHLLDASIPNPMIGVHQKEFGKGFTSMYRAYGLSDIIRNVILHSDKIERKLLSVSGTYVATAGPSFESQAEAESLARDAHLAGMSTVPSVIALRSMGITDIGALSLVTNNTPAISRNTTLVTHEENTEVSKKAEPRFKLLLEEIVAAIA